MSTQDFDLSIDADFDFDLDLALDLEDAPTDLPTIDYPGDLAGDAEAELTAVQREFRARMKRENKRRADATDSEYWFCACGQSRDQVTAFLKAVGMDPNAKYIDLQKLAKRLNIELPVAPPPPSRRKIDRDWAELAL